MPNAGLRPDARFISALSEWCNQINRLSRHPQYNDLNRLFRLCKASPHLAYKPGIQLIVKINSPMKGIVQDVRFPSFFVIGAGRSGTTSLHRYLSQHPDLYLARKNPGFFYCGETNGEQTTGSSMPKAEHFIASRDDYLRLFAKAPPEALTGDVSPVYLASTRVAARIANCRPDAKLIALLRNPADRVYSRYISRKRDGLEQTPTFEALLDRERLETLVRDDAHGTYLAGGMVSHFLQTYYDFFPRAQIAVFLYEEFAANTADVMRRICAFLGVNEHFPFNVSEIHNRGGGRIQNKLLGKIWAASEPARRSLRPLLPEKLRDRAFRNITNQTVKVSLNPETRLALAELYRSEIIRLQKMVGADLSTWLP